MTPRRVLVTGGARGLGRAMVERFLADGAEVAILDIDLATAEATAAELSSAGTVIAARVDVTDASSVELAVAEVVERLGGLDVLVNNAALLSGGGSEDASLDYLERVLRLNMISLWLVTRAAAPHLVRSAAGRVVNISSGNAYSYAYRGATDEFPGLASFGYGWAKWGVIGLTKFSAGQLGHWGVTVNAVAPGPTPTAAMRATIDPALIARLASERPIPGDIEPRDAADAVAYFASPGARFVTGQLLVVDGGRHMPA